MLAIAPMSSPPAERPMAKAFFGSWYLLAASQRVTSMKSVKVFFLLSSLPSSYQSRPISCPPRMCAMATTKPRSSSEGGR